MDLCFIDSHRPGQGVFDLHVPITHPLVNDVITFYTTLDVPFKVKGIDCYSRRIGLSLFVLYITRQGVFLVDTLTPPTPFNKGAQALEAAALKCIRIEQK